MVKMTRNKELLKRLEALQVIANRKCSSEVIYIDLEEFLASKFSDFETFFKEKTKKSSDDTVVIVDDMPLQVNIYLDTDLILSSPKDVILKFFKAAEKNDEIEYMKLYIQLFEEAFDLKDIPSKEYFMTDPSLNFLNGSLFADGKHWTEEEHRERYWEMEVSEIADKFDVYAEVFAKMSPFYKDFMEHFKILSVEELVERYKDQRFFKMIRSHTCETQK